MEITPLLPLGFNHPRKRRRAKGLGFVADKAEFEKVEANGFLLLSHWTQVVRCKLEGPC